MLNANGETIYVRPDGVQQRFRNNKPDNLVEVIELDDDASKMDDCHVDTDSKVIFFCWFEYC